jgi:spindle assembly abnormal protein 6
MFPLVAEPLRAWEGFDVQSATTLYWKPVDVLVRQPDREELVCELTVRILQGVNKATHSSRVG